MLSRSEGLLAAAMLAAAPLCLAADPPPTYTGTTTEPAKPAAAGRAAPAPQQGQNAAEAAAAARTLQGLDAQLRDSGSALGKTEECFALETSLKNDASRKRAELGAEYKGRIPPAFEDLLFQKSERAVKQHKACFAQYEAVGRQLAALDVAFANIEPKSLNVKRQRAAADEQKRKYLLLVPTAKPYNKAPAPKAAGAP